MAEIAEPDNDALAGVLISDGSPALMDGSLSKLHRAPSSEPLAPAAGKAAAVNDEPAAAAGNQSLGWS